MQHFSHLQDTSANRWVKICNQRKPQGFRAERASQRSGCSGNWNNRNHGIKESWNSSGGKGTSRLSCFNPPPMGRISSRPQSPILPGLAHFQGCHNFFGQSVPGPHHSHNREFLPNIKCKPALFQFKYITLVLSLHTLVIRTCAVLSHTSSQWACVGRSLQGRVYLFFLYSNCCCGKTISILQKNWFCLNFLP